MTPPLPISLCFWTSTKGHFGHRDVWRATLAHLDRQIPLRTFGALIAHVKVTPGEETLGAEMCKDLCKLGFETIATVADWSRGQSHQMAYMQDVVKLSKESAVYTQPYMLWLEDDQTITPHACSAEDLLLRSCRMLALDNELTSVRLLRASDLSTSPMVTEDSTTHDSRWFHSPHFNFQPALLRSRDFYLGARLVEANPEGAATIQCEMLWRMVLTIFSRSPRQHRVYHPSFAETIHLGTPDYPALKVSLNL